MKLGIKAKVYRNTSGNYAAPTWVEVNKISDLAVGSKWDEGDAGTRASRVKKSAKTMLGLEVTGRIQVSNDDAGYIALWNAAHDDTALDLMILNGPSTENGVRGYRGYYQVFSQDEDQAMGNVLYMDFTLKPTPGDNEPQKVVVSGGAPVFSSVAA